MKRIAIGFVSLALITIPAYLTVTSQPAQPRCSLTEANSPSVRGLRLGMTAEQVIALFPGSAKNKDMKPLLDKAKSTTGSETVYLSFDSSTSANKEKFADVASISVGFYKARVKDLDVDYVGTSWTNVDEWVAKLSETFKLPGLEAWVVGPSENPNKVLKCNGIEIEAATQGGGASIRIRDTEYAMREGANAGEEGKRRAFKP